MSVEQAVVSLVIERLGELLINEAKFLYGVKHQVENANIKLQCMRAFLKDADTSVKNGDERVRLLVVQIRENSYALEDVIETYVFKVAYNNNNVGAIRRVLNNSLCIFIKGINAHKVGSEIERISSNIDAWTSELERYGVKKSIDNAAETCSSSYVKELKQLRQAYSHVEDNHVVGFDKDMEDLVTLLMEEKNTYNHKVISVYGMGGLGKTTLARKVYQHPQIRTHFDHYAWASISQQCNARDVLEGILFDLTSPTDAERNHIRSLSDVELGRKLHDFQKQWKCLVLLDDIWTTKTWDLLKHGFPQGDAESKILLTTRNKDVALHVDQHGFIHQPHLLNDDQSWELFQNKYYSCIGIDPSNSNEDERKKELAVEMLKKCAGLPLAIIVLAGLLSKKHTIYEWEQINRNVLSSIGQHNGSEHSSVLGVLGLSYSELPYYLKPCFLSLARYAEDATIRVKGLCRLLIAEGFISPRGSNMESMEDLAYDCLSELVERSMIQVKEMSSTLRIKSISIHDLMRDLCVSKAQEENCLHFMDLRIKEPIETSVSTLSITKVRRLAIHYDHESSDYDFAAMVGNLGGSLRCLTVHGQSRIALEKKVVRYSCKQLLMLRVLIIDYSSSAVSTLKLPKEIGNLIHLRLFSIPNREIEKIPSSFGNFRCLQTLRVSSDKIPSSMCKLQHLRHLNFGRFRCVGIGQFLRSAKSRNLQTLVGIGTKNLVLSDLLQLKNLKKLTVHMDENFDTFLHNPQTLTFTSLLSLHVYNFKRVKIDIVPLISICSHISKLGLVSPIVRLPEFNQFSPNLMKLRLFSLRLEDDPMPTLEKLPKLRILIIANNSFMGDEMVCSRGGFDRLESLELVGLHGLKELKVEESTLSRLGYLRIQGCRGLRRVPDGLRNIFTLNRVLIRGMPKKFKERMEEGGEDFYKVNHVTSRVCMDCDGD